MARKDNLEIGFHFSRVFIKKKEEEEEEESLF